ncbi:MAG: hypothetical protein J5842_06875 [Lachnospiraceae bacterium]|nr:hypothetical protein [Lachnospiraceae bacterium]
MEKEKFTITREMVKETTQRLCAQNNMPEDFFKDFWDMLSDDDEVYLEYVHYLVYNDFKCSARAGDITITDVLVWQIDHFKAQLDVDTTPTRQGGSMILLAFETFLKMRKDPGRYISRLREDTGTDYPGKFNGL